MISLAYATQQAATSDYISTAESGPVVTGVLIALIVMSALTWAIAFFKLWQQQRIQKSNRRFLEAFYSNRKLKEIARAADTEPHSGAGQLFQTAHHELETLRTTEGTITNLGVLGLLRLTERTLESTISSIRTQRERYLTFLASTASGGPFIGLFGTVWGIMNAFEGIGKMGSASLAVVAPGISEALIATATGLMAAIPAALFYNFFQRKIDEEDAALGEFRLELLNLFEAYVFPGLLKSKSTTQVESRNGAE